MKKRQLVLLATLVLLVSVHNLGVANGRPSIELYWAMLRFTDDGVKLDDRPGGRGMLFSCDIEIPFFRLCTVDGRYRLIKIEIENITSESLRLSSTEDDIIVKFGVDTEDVHGIMDMKKHDPEFWGSLNQDMESILAYPSVVSAGEMKEIYIFLPLSEVDGLPSKIYFKIESVSGLAGFLAKGVPIIHDSGYIRGR